VSKIIEGAIDMYFNANGEVNRMVNRKVFTLHVEAIIHKNSGLVFKLVVFEVTEADWADVRRTEEFKKRVTEELAAEKAAKAKRFAKYL